MLAALLMLGILPFAFAMDSFATNEDETGNTPDAGNPGAQDMDMLDPPDQLARPEPIDDELTDDLDAEPDEQETERDPEDHEVSGEAGEVLLPEFRPGTDSLAIDVTGQGSGFWVEFEQEPDGASLSLFGEDAETPGLSVLFEGLPEVPVADVSLVGTEDGGPFDYALTSLIADADPMPMPGQPELEGDGEDPLDAANLVPGDAPVAASPVGGLEPVEHDTDAGLDPVSPDDFGDAGPDDSDPGHDPVDPEDFGDAGPAVDDPGLDPVNPDAPPPGSDGAQGLADLIRRDSDWDIGAEVAEDRAGAQGAMVSTLDDAGNAVDLPDDGQDGTGEGQIGTHQGGAAITSSGPIAVVDGAAGDDTLQSGDGAAYLFGGEGEDQITGGEGVLAGFGGAGDDTLTAGSGAAYLDGGTGDDVIVGGPGDDILNGGSHADPSLVSDADEISGGAGDDTLRGGHGADVLSGGDGNDTIDHFGASEPTAGADAAGRFAARIDGADDTLSGGDGDDTLIFDGSDTASGGAGADLFWLHHDSAGAAGVAEVTDFEVGADMLRVTLNPEAGHGQSPDYAVETAPNGQDAEVRVDGALIAVLRGGAGATTSDVYVEVVREVFA